MHNSLTTAFSDFYCRGPWVSFGNTSTADRFCQPDCFFVDVRRGLLVIAEIKIKHTERAWWQLRQLYEPVMRNLLADAPWRFACLEIVRSYDPAVPFPERHDFVDNPLTMQDGQFGVLMHRV